MRIRCPNFRELAGALLVLVIPSALSPAFAADRVPAPPPPARVEPFREQVQGVELLDPYRWMENERDPELATWRAAQQRYADELLGTSSGWTGLRDRFAALMQSMPTLGSVTPVPGGALLDRWLEDGKSIHFWREDSGSEVPVVTRAGLSAAGRPDRIREVSPSWDGRYVACATTGAGDGSASISVIEIETGRILPDFVPDLLTTTSGSRYRVTWLPDSSGFVYPRLAPGAAEGPAKERLGRGRQALHRIGRPTSEDVDLFGLGVDPAIDVAVDDLPATTVAAPGSAWLVATLYRVVEDRSELWAARWNESYAGVGPWHLVAESGYGSPRLRGNDLFALTSLAADRRRLVAIDLAAAEPVWRDVVPEREGVLLRYTLLPDGVVYTELGADQTRLMRWSTGAAAPERIAVPISGGLHLPPQDPGRAEPWVEAMNWVDPGGWFRVPGVGKVARRAGVDPGGDMPGASGDLVVESLRVPVAPEIEVPVSIVRPRRIPRGGTSVLLEAYGGYGQIHQSEFNPFALLWAQHGGTYVYAHVRGGGELGEAWHRAATREGKIASTTDTLRVAEWLVEKRLTRRGWIALIGTSSGAQIPGLALALAPELFGVVVFNVGAPDEIRGAQLDPTAARNLAEMGDLTTAHGVELLREVSPYHRVPVSAHLPAVVVKSARDDYNFGGVSAAMKYVARLQAANRGARPVVWLDQPGGHSDVFGEDPEIVGRTMAFLFWQTGHPRFGPRP